MKDSDIKTISDCVNIANKMPFSEVEKWIQHLECNQNNDTHLEVKEAILSKLRTILRDGMYIEEHRSGAEELRQLEAERALGGVGRKEVNKGLEPSWTDCCDGI